MGSARRVRRGMAAVYARRREPGVPVTNRLAVIAASCVFSAAAWSQTAPKPTAPKPAPSKAAEPLKIEYPAWLFPIDEDAVKAYKISKLPKPPAPPPPPPKEPAKKPAKDAAPP